jgi:Phage integrase, N-terminal SAM-like domain
MPRLLDQVRETTRRLHYSIRTEDAYVDWIRRFILFHAKRHPLEMGEPEVVAFLTHLAVQKDVAASSQNHALCALLFLYKVVLGKPLAWIEGDAVRAKTSSGCRPSSAVRRHAPSWPSSTAPPGSPPACCTGPASG